MSGFSEDITLKKSILEILTVANEYCHFIENIGNKSAGDILEFIDKIGPLLYLKGTLIPDIAVQNPEANERFVTSEQWENIFYALREKLGPKDEFWIIDPQYINKDEPLKASLSENIADIYQDMKDFLLLYQKNTFAARENAVNECRSLFGTHWGYRIANILPKVHHLLYESEEGPPNFRQSLDTF